ncbi:peptidase S41, partial [Bacillus altitudinis]
MNRRVIAFFMAGSLLAGSGGTYAGMQWFYYSQKEAGLEHKSGLEGKEDPGSGATGELGKVGQAYELILGSYVEKVEGEQLAEGAIQGMLSTLDD